MGGKGNVMKTTSVAFEIIETLRAMNGARIVELADKLDMPKSTAHRYLSTLESEEYLVKEGDEYNIGLRFLTLGEYAQNRKRSYQMIEPKVEELAEETDERVQFMVEEHGNLSIFFRRLAVVLFTPQIQALVNGSHFTSRLLARRFYQNFLIKGFTKSLIEKSYQHGLSSQSQIKKNYLMN